MVVISEADAFSDRRFLVTGAAGYVGSRICIDLLHRGAKEVRGFDTSAESSPELLEHAGDQRLKLVNGDITDPAAVAAALKGIDCVFHADSYGRWGKEIVEERRLHSVNLDGTLALVQACVSKGVGALVFTSYVDVVMGEGKQQEVRDGDESMPYISHEEHHDSFGRTCALAEQMVMKVNGRKVQNRRDPIFSCVLRAPLIYGPREASLLPRLVRSLDGNRFLSALTGPPTVRSDWLHVDNFVHAHALAMASLLPESAGRGEEERREGKGKGVVAPPAAGRVYFITDDAPVNSFDFVRPLVEASGQRMPTRRMSMAGSLRLAAFAEAGYRIHSAFTKGSAPAPSFLLTNELERVASYRTFSCARAKRELGYRPIADRHLTIARLADEFRERSARRTFLEVPFYGKVLVPTLVFGIGLLAYIPLLPSLSLLSGYQPGLKYLWWVLFVAHVLEGVTAWAIASANQHLRQDAMSWGLQTFFCGFLSFSLLLRAVKRTKDMPAQKTRAESSQAGQAAAAVGASNAEAAGESAEGADEKDSQEAGSITQVDRGVENNNRIPPPSGSAVLGALSVLLLCLSAFLPRSALPLPLNYGQDIFLALFKDRETLRLAWWALVGVHSLEATGAYLLARSSKWERKHALSWAVQVLLFGIFSLQALLRRLKLGQVLSQAGVRQQEGQAHVSSASSSGANPSSGSGTGDRVLLSPFGVPSPSFFEWFSILAGLLLLYCSAFYPRHYLSTPLQWVQQLGMFIFMSREALQLVWWAAWAAHAVEAAVAVGFAIGSPTEGKNAIGWGLQTLLIGGPSLTRLLRRLREYRDGVEGEVGRKKEQ